jgi:hypothetical protein
MRTRLSLTAAPAPPRTSDSRAVEHRWSTYLRRAPARGCSVHATDELQGRRGSDPAGCTAGLARPGWQAELTSASSAARSGRPTIAGARLAYGIVVAAAAAAAATSLRRAVLHPSAAAATWRQHSRGKRPSTSNASAGGGMQGRPRTWISRGRARASRAHLRCCLLHRRHRPLCQCRHPSHPLGCHHRCRVLQHIQGEHSRDNGAASCNTSRGSTVEMMGQAATQLSWWAISPEQTRHHLNLHQARPHQSRWPGHPSWRRPLRPHRHPGQRRRRHRRHRH